MAEQFHERLRRVQFIFPTCHYRIDIGLIRIKEFIDQYCVDMDPDYQRGYVWTTEQKQLFVGSVFQAPTTIPIFWFNWTKENKSSEVVDGKQRMNAIIEWLDGNYTAICPCGEEFHVSDIDDIGKRNLSWNITLKMHFTKLSRIDVMKFYLSLNCGGTIHSQNDLDKVRELINKSK